MADWIGVDVGKPTRVTTCGHAPHWGKGLCKRCYHAEWSRLNADKRRATRAAWRKANAEREAETMRAYSEAHKDAKVEYDRQRYKAKREEKLAAVKAWRQANPERVQASAKRHRLRRYDPDADLTVEQWRQILVEFEGHCAYCDVSGVPLEQEHMIPVSRGGAHTASNVIPACRSCNASKSSKTSLEFAGWEIPPRRRPNADHR